MHQVLKSVRKGSWRRVGEILSVPYPVLDKINTKYSSPNEKMSAVASYLVNVIPGITWDTIATELYKMDEERAVELSRPYLHVIHGRSCCCITGYLCGPKKYAFAFENQF